MLKPKFTLTAVIATLALTGAFAQNEDNALSYSLLKPTGTARSISLGGAMGAVGGDYSAIGINPAGIAIYRSNEFSFTPSLMLSDTDSKYYGTSTSEEKFSVPLNHVSYVGTMMPMRAAESGLVSTHFAIGYNRTNNYNRKSYIQASGVESSLLDMFISNSDGRTLQELDNFYTGIAYDARLTELRPGFDASYYNGYEYIDSNNDPQWGASNLEQMKVINENGYSGLFDLSFGANFSNKFYLGASLGIASLYNKMESQHYERAGGYYQDYLNYRDGNDELAVLDDFYFDERERTTGVGVNLKLGMIVRPVKNLRLGVAFHTPTYYSMDMEYETRARSNFINADNYDIVSPVGDISYNFRTPLKAVGSLALLLGDKGLISVDYEYTDYSTMQYRSKHSNLTETRGFNDINDVITSTFQATHDLRFGAEVKLTPMVALRGGYDYFQNPYKKEFLNSGGDRYNITGGIGFRHQNMFVDLAYLYRYQSYIHSLYYSPNVEDKFQEPANMTTVDHQVAVTVGWKF